MALLPDTLIKASDANNQYWFVKQDCGEFASIVNFQKITNNSTMVIQNCTINDSDLTDCDGNVYSSGRVLVINLSGGENETVESCKIVYTTTMLQTDSLIFNIKIDDRGY